MLTHFICSADLPMSFEDRVAAVGIATQFQEHNDEVFKMVEEETDNVKTQASLGLKYITNKGGFLPFPIIQTGCFAGATEKQK